MTQNLDLRKECFAQGVSNALSPFFSTFAGSGSCHRTSVALEVGVRTPLSGMIAALAVVLIASTLGPLLTYLPMPGIAGGMALVGIGIVKPSEIRPLWNRIDGAAFLITPSAVVFLGLEVGILVAVVASVGFLVASMSVVKLTISREGGEERVAVTGNLFYASLDRLARHLHRDPAARAVLDLSRVSHCDATAKELIEKVRAERSRAGGRLEVAPTVIG